MPPTDGSMISRHLSTSSPEPSGYFSKWRVTLLWSDPPNVLKNTQKALGTRLRHLSRLPHQNGIQMGLANDLNNRHSHLLNAITNLVQCENIAKSSLMKLQQATAVLNVMIPHKHTRSFTSCALQNLTDNSHQ